MAKQHCKRRGITRKEETDQIVNSTKGDEVESYQTGQRADEQIRDEIDEQRRVFGCASIAEEANAWWVEDRDSHRLFILCVGGGQSEYGRP